MCHPARPRGDRRGPLVRVAATAGATLLLSVSGILPASALGEDGTFPLPLESSSISLLPDAVTSVPLDALIDDAQQDQLDESSARLAVPPSLGETDAAAMAVSEDGRTLTVSGEGTWSPRPSQSEAVGAPAARAGTRSAASPSVTATTTAATTAPFGSAWRSRPIPATRRPMPPSHMEARSSVARKAEVRSCRPATRCCGACG